MCAVCVENDASDASMRCHDLHAKHSLKEIGSKESCVWVPHIGVLLSEGEAEVKLDFELVTAPTSAVVGGLETTLVGDRLPALSSLPSSSSSTSWTSAAEAASETLSTASPSSRPVDGVRSCIVDGATWQHGQQVHYPMDNTQNESSCRNAVYELCSSVTKLFLI